MVCLLQKLVKDLKAYGADSLSKLDPKNYSALMEEAGGIGID